MPLPPCEDKKTVADQFNSFFTMKIEKIMEGLVPTDTHPVHPVYLESEMETAVILHEFRPITLDENKKLILSAAPKSCKLDPIPMKLLRNHIDVYYVGFSFCLCYPVMTQGLFSHWTELNLSWPQAFAKVTYHGFFKCEGKC